MSGVSFDWFTFVLKLRKYFDSQGKKPRLE
jgi:hypothetical protein